MMIPLSLIDVAPDPVGIGVVLAVVLLVVGFIVLLLAALVFFLWYRKRSLRKVEMIRPHVPLTVAEPAQANSSNQP